MLTIDRGSEEVKIGITGATGFLGRALISAIAAEGHQVVAWARDPDAAKRSLFPGNTVTTWISGHLGDQESADSLCSQCDAIVHAAVDRNGEAFIGTEGNPAEYFDANVTGTVRLLEAATSQGIHRFVFISSGAVHQKVADDRPLDETHPLWPASIYGAYKASVETLIHAYGFSGKLDCCTVRPTAIYGVADPIENSKWFSLIQDVIRGESVTPSGGGKVVHAADVAKAAFLCLTTDQAISGETFNCCDRFVSHHEVATIAKRLSGSSAEIQGAPKSEGNRMSTEKLRSLGMQFGSTVLLEETISQIIKPAAEQ